MKFTVTIDLENAAFHPDPTPEIARILAGLVKEIPPRLGFYFNGGLQGAEKTLFDINGNRVGVAKITKPTRRGDVTVKRSRRIQDDAPEDYPKGDIRQMGTP